MTFTEGIRGALASAAPEPLVSAVPTDDRVDIFGAGVVIFELAIGAAPSDLAKPGPVLDGLDATDRQIVGMATAEDPNDG